MLKIEDLKVKIDGKEVLKGLNLQVKAGEVHAIMGPNGSGKSTLSKVLSGHPSYEVTAGTVEYDVNLNYKNLLLLNPEERAREGLFLAFQYPTEIPGVSNLTFLHQAFNAICKHQGAPEMDELSFYELARKKSELVDMNPEFLKRSVNAGFSGGEKKRNEILQMAILNPRLAILDETDSGLDIDSLKIVGTAVHRLRTKFNAILLVTHYQRLLDTVPPDYVHVMIDGRIVKSGDKDLALKLEREGYEWI